MYVTYGSHLPTATCTPQDTWRSCKRYSRIVGQTIVFALTTIFFLGQVFKEFPASITNTALVLLNGVGLIYLPYIVDLIKKTLIDARISHQTKQRSLALLSLTHAAELISNMALTITGFAASEFGAAKQEKIQNRLYKVMVPWGETTLLVGIAVAVGYFLISYHLLKNFDENRKLEIAQAVRELNSLERIDEDLQSALRLRYCMDKDTLEQFLELVNTTHDERQLEELMNLTIDNIRTQTQVALGGQLGLTAIGYLCLAIEKGFPPTSPVRATLNFGISLAYLVKIYIETIQEVIQRELMQRRTITS